MNCSQSLLEKIELFRDLHCINVDFEREIAWASEDWWKIHWPFLCYLEGHTMQHIAHLPHYKQNSLNSLMGHGENMGIENSLDEWQSYSSKEGDSVRIASNCEFQIGDYVEIIEPYPSYIMENGQERMTRVGDVVQISGFKKQQLESNRLVENEYVSIQYNHARRHGVRSAGNPKQCLPLSKVALAPIPIH